MKLTLIEKKQEVPGVESFIWQPERPLSWQAGQYLHYTLPHDAPDDRGIERWFTISSPPYEGHPTITTRFAGDKGSSFKKALLALEVGATIEAEGPEGDFTIEDARQEYVLIAGGIGITPFHSILMQADHDGTKLKATLLYGNRDTNVPFRAALETFAANNPSLVIHYLTEPERIDAAAIAKYVPDLTKPLFYISGPEPMVKALGEVVKGMGVPHQHIKLDDFPGYPAI